METTDERRPGAAVPAATSPASTKNIGLRGVYVADTMVSHVDGEAGTLIYRGYDIRQLADQSTYEETAYLLIFGELPLEGELASFSEQLGAERRLEDWQVAAMRALPASTAPMEVLQAQLALLGAGEGPPAVRWAPRPAQAPSASGAPSEAPPIGPAPLAGAQTAAGAPPAKLAKEEARQQAVNAVGKTAAIVAAWDRIRRGLEPVPAQAGNTHALDFLSMLHGSPPDPVMARALDRALILHADHDMNASTFVARAVASTRADLYAALSAAVGALSGELHGGATAKVMEMLEEIGEPGRVEDYVRSRLASGDVVMGMGHAVYRTDDPRSLILRAMAQELSRELGSARWWELADRVRSVTQDQVRAAKGKDIYPNVDMYSGSLYSMMDIPRDLFTPVFAVARSAGWAAHVLEERFAEAQQKATIYRPLAEYVGHYCGRESCDYLPAAQRVASA